MLAGYLSEIAEDSIVEESDDAMGPNQAVP